MNNPSAFEQREEIDTNINNYTLSEILTILDLNNQFTSQDVIDSTNYYIFQSTQANNTQLSNFFQDVQDYLLDFLKGNPITQDKTYAPLEKQTLDWWNNESLQQKDPVQKDKITNRVQQIGIYGNDHVPMNRKQLGINNNFNVSVSQDTLNPNLTNSTNRFINLDSQFRQPTTTSSSSSATDYTLDLSEPLSNVLSMWLYSIQIPKTWYTYDNQYGNTCFWLLFDPTNSNIFFKISIPPGNYNPNEIVSILNTSNNFSTSCFTWPTAPTDSYPVSYNKNNGKITMNLFGGKYIDPNTNISYDINNNTKILFFDINSNLKCDLTNCNPNNNINQTFGWYLGYKEPSIFVKQNGNTADTIINTYGPKYLILVIDDYNQNHINNGLITITETSTNIKIPIYYTPKLPVVCLSPPLINDTVISSDKNNISYTTTPIVVPTAPRILTQAQIYSINEINKNNHSNTSFKSRAPTNPDIFALIPVKLSYTDSTTSNSVYVEFSGSLQENKRIYFGPVNIERLRIKLLDENGNILNLNGADWSVTIIAEVLYQY
jgi:hypothetical protein